MSLAPLPCQGTDPFRAKVQWPVAEGFMCLDQSGSGRPWWAGCAPHKLPHTASVFPAAKVPSGLCTGELLSHLPHLHTLVLLWILLPDFLPSRFPLALQALTFLGLSTSSLFSQHPGYQASLHLCLCNCFLCFVHGWILSAWCIY